MCQILWPNVLISCLMVYSFLMKSFTVVFNSLLWVTIEHSKAFHNFFGLRETREREKKTLTDTHISFCSHCICVYRRTSYILYTEISVIPRCFFLYLQICFVSLALPPFECNFDCAVFCVVVVFFKPFS